MLGALSHTRVLRLAGLFTWVMVGLPLVYSQIENLRRPASDNGGAVLLFAAYLVFGGAYFRLTRDLRSGGHASWLDRGMLVLLTISALGVSFLSGSGLGSILMMVAAGVIPWMLPARYGVLWLLVSQLAVAPVYYVLLRFPLFEAVMQSLLYGGFSMFIFVTSLVARQQTDAREEQRQLNTELRATRVLLAESARVNERTRISRELHDLLGHHLTALSLNLEVAGHITEGRAQEHVHQAHTLAKLLLTDVREAVSQLRDSGAIDLAAALRPLTQRVPSLDVHLDVPSPLNVEDPERAHVLLRCTQEIITNAVRHAGARNLWITVRREAGGVSLEARDDGNGADGIMVGNGLRGMRERLQQCGGELQIETHRGQGFRLRASVPGVPALALSTAPEGVR
ncbi:sensor histidine kinase [Stenotrophomonas sp. Sa5BUN4]|jgi:signal transduction histidine kinase|uniref:Sensor histidine kinase n=2 Tax=Stenotrophomonas TaxID=40323 RepID=A0A8X8K464_9GAMM|nr:MULTISPECIES: sensor histidine kinase [Stenotrophomonas]KIP80392.1 histidine kinase [Stenotrophomonas maltophilia]MBD7954874.1 sensor histidine kinase [Stenotrophomonas pennii]MBD8642405.1 sensor histidine kinase [Stenotrophomonas sp. CFBP 13724]MDX3931115.1 sensor histidine kinase [Stenotrophomonas sp.]MDY1032956.1 sensor histidine kinase [Stenotrophomonas sp. CFBP8980]